MGGQGRFRPVVGRLRRAVMRLILGRRFLHTLERNREAADLLDTVLKEMLQR